MQINTTTEADLVFSFFKLISVFQGEPVPFVPFSHRYHTPAPYEAGSTEPFWYSIKRGPAHVIIMAAYSAFGKYLLDFLVWFAWL